MKRLLQTIIVLCLCMIPVFSANLSQIQLQSTSIEHDSFSDAICATGFIVNNSNETVNLVVKINLYNSNGQFTESHICQVEGLEPHILWRFVSYPIKKESKTMKVVSIQLK